VLDRLIAPRASPTVGGRHEDGGSTPCVRRPDHGPTQRAGRAPFGSLATTAIHPFSAERDGAGRVRHDDTGAQPERAMHKKRGPMSTHDDRHALGQKIFVLLAEVVGESVDGDSIEADTEFTETGMSSIQYLEFIDKVESTFGVAIDLESDRELTTVDKFVDVLLREGAAI
jgi:acyl carrier protein